MPEQKLESPIPENIRDLGISQEYFDKIHGLYLLANEQDFMEFLKVITEQNITLNF